MTLDQIATAMRDDAERAGSAWRTLRRGLHLSLHRRRIEGGYLWLLVLSRDDVPPSAQELTICRSAFRVPERADVETINRMITVCWQETIPVAQPVIEQGSLL